MKKIIDQKKYDTEASGQMGRWDNCYNWGDHNNCTETLYKTGKGQHFLHGQGGCQSKYSEPCGQNSWTGGEDIILFTEAEAYEWCELRDLPDVIEMYFADLIEEG
jgi:hypothetical protein